jgi:hypothetical protein
MDFGRRADCRQVWISRRSRTTGLIRSLVDRRHLRLVVGGWHSRVCLSSCESIQHSIPERSIDLSSSATATKANWITLVTGISHERLQVFHRWISYAFFILALLHTFPFIVYHVHFHEMQEEFKSGLLFYWTGIAALIAQAWLTFLSHSTIRQVTSMNSISTPANMSCVPDASATNSSKQRTSSWPSYSW